VLGNRVLRRISGSEREEVAGSWGRLHNEELHNLYALPNVIRAIKSRRIRLGGTCSMHGRDKDAYKILVEKSEGKRPLGIHRNR